MYTNVDGQVLSIDLRSCSSDRFERSHVGLNDVDDRLGPRYPFERLIDCGL